MEIIVPECAAERRIVQFVALQSVELFELSVNSGVVVQLWGSDDGLSRRSTAAASAYALGSAYRCEASAISKFSGAMFAGTVTPT